MGKNGRKGRKKQGEKEKVYGKIYDGFGCGDNQQPLYPV